MKSPPPFGKDRDRENEEASISGRDGMPKNSSLAVENIGTTIKAKKSNPQPSAKSRSNHHGQRRGAASHISILPAPAAPRSETEKGGHCMGHCSF